MERLRLALLASLTPLICLAVLCVALIVWRFLELPTPEETLNIIERWFDAYGLPLIFLAALFEGIAVINIYVPGSAVIVLGVVLSRGDPIAASLVVFCTTVAFVITAQINYAIGYFGLHNLLRKLGGGVLIDRAHSYWSQHGERTLPIAFVHPNIGGFVSIAAGNGHFPFVRFILLSILYISFWNVLWGFAAYLFADALTNAATQPMYLLGALSIWAAATFLWHYVRHASHLIR